MGEVCLSLNNAICLSTQRFSLQEQLTEVFESVGHVVGFRCRDIRVPSIFYPCSDMCLCSDWYMTEILESLAAMASVNSRVHQSIFSGK